MVAGQELRVVGPTRRYAFVVPRFGEGIAGGAETLVGSLARQLAARGDRVEVLTTCARDNRSWENEFPAGEDRAYGVPVRRFAVDPRNLERWVPLQIAISDGIKLSVDDQLDWMSESVNSSGLYDYLSAHGLNYDAVFFAPYLFGTTFWGALIHPVNSYLIPCLHDEHYAYLEVIQSMFRQVAGCLFNSAPEQELASTLYGDLRGGEVGMGFNPVPDSEIEALAPYFSEQFPYILYLGRKETGKNAQLLVDCFIAYKGRANSRQELKLVIAGGGSFDDLHRPEAKVRADIIDLDHLSEAEKQRVIRHALLLCQPSTNESFSIVLMESWLLGTPVLVHGDCRVTRQHVVESGGGLYFSSEDDFAAVVELLSTNKDLRRSMGMAGGSYVGERYSWKAVLDRFDMVMGQLLTIDAHSLEA